MDMKRAYLVLITFFFLCVIVLTLVSARIIEGRAVSPTYLQKQEWVFPRRLPYFAP